MAKTDKLVGYLHVEREMFLDAFEHLTMATTIEVLLTHCKTFSLPVLEQLARFCEEFPNPQDFICKVISNNPILKATVDFVAFLQEINDTPQHHPELWNEPLPNSSIQTVLSTVDDDTAKRVLGIKEDKIQEYIYMKLMDEHNKLRQHDLRFAEHYRASFQNILESLHWLNNDKLN